MWLDDDVGRPLAAVAAVAAACLAIPCAEATARATDGASTPETGAPIAFPTPPLALRAPVVGTPVGAERRWFAARLFTEARAAMSAGDRPTAIRLATASVDKNGRGHLLLARAYAAENAIEPGLYWLERAAMEEGVDPREIAEDAALAPLRRDPRWAAVAEFAGRAVAYWSRAERGEISVVEREPRRGPTRAIVVWLPPNGEAPDDDLAEVCSARLRRRGVVCVGVSAPRALGPKTYRWSSEPEENARRVASLLEDAHARGVDTAKPIVLIGSIEGAQAALETAARAPARYRGAIALSPGGLPWHLDEVAPNLAVARQHYVVACGSDRFAKIGVASVDIDLLQALGAGVARRPTWFYGKDDALPPDLDARLPRWVEKIVEAD